MERIYAYVRQWCLEQILANGYIYVVGAQRISGPLRKSVNLKKGDILEYRLFINK